VKAIENKVSSPLGYPQFGVIAPKKTDRPEASNAAIDESNLSVKAQKEVRSEGKIRLRPINEHTVGVRRKNKEFCDVKKHSDPPSAVKRGEEKTGGKSGKVIPIKVGPVGDKIDLEHLGYKWHASFTGLDTPPDDSPLDNRDMKEALLKMQERNSRLKAGDIAYLPAVKKGLRRHLEQVSFAQAAREMGKINSSDLFSGKKTVYFLPVQMKVGAEGAPGLQRTAEKPLKINKKRDFIAVYKKTFGHTEVKGLVLNEAKLDEKLDKPVPVIDNL